MRQHLLLDTNIIIGILNDAIPFKLFEQGEWRISVSAVTIMELYALAGPGRDEEQRIDAAVMLLEVIPVDRVVARHAGILARTRRRGKPDLLIAATALEHEIPLVTNNIRDFKHIPGLRVWTIADLNTIT